MVAHRSRRETTAIDLYRHTTASRHLPAVVLEQPTQSHPALDRTFRRRRSPVARQRQVVLALMRALFVIMNQMLSGDVVEIAFAYHDEMIQRLALHRLRPTLSERVQIGASQQTS